MVLLRNMRRNWRRPFREDGGQALVEFALALPLLLVLLTGIFQFGSAYYQYQALSDAVRAGARTLALERGSLDPCDPAMSQTLQSSDNLLTSSMIMNTAPSNPTTTSYLTASFASGTSPLPDYCASSNTTSGCGSTATAYTYNSSYTSTTTDGGCEVEGDEVTVSAGVPYTLNVFGMGIFKLSLKASASDAVE